MEKCTNSPLESESPVLDVATSDTDSVNPLGTDTSVGCLPAELKLSLLAVVSPAGTGSGALVARIASETHLVS